MRVGDVENDEARPSEQAPAVHPIWQSLRSPGLHSLPVCTRLSGSRIFWQSREQLNHEEYNGFLLSDNLPPSTNSNLKNHIARLVLLLLPLYGTNRSRRSMANWRWKIEPQKRKFNGYRTPLLATGLSAPIILSCFR
jgi:hypothetical protein